MCILCVRHGIAANIFTDGLRYLRCRQGPYLYCILRAWPLLSSSEENMFKTLSQPSKNGRHPFKHLKFLSFIEKLQTTYSPLHTTTEHRSLSLLHFNARSIKCKFSDISAELSALDLLADVIFITETWLSLHSIPSQCSLPGCSVFHSFRND